MNSAGALVRGAGRMARASGVVVVLDTAAIVKLAEPPLPAGFTAIGSIRAGEHGVYLGESRLETMGWDHFAH